MASERLSRRAGGSGGPDRAGLPAAPPAARQATRGHADLGPPARAPATVGKSAGACCAQRVWEIAQSQCRAALAGVELRQCVDWCQAALYDEVSHPLGRASAFARAPSARSRCAGSLSLPGMHRTALTVAAEQPVQLQDQHCTHAVPEVQQAPGVSHTGTGTGTRVQPTLAGAAQRSCPPTGSPMPLAAWRHASQRPSSSHQAAGLTGRSWSAAGCSDLQVACQQAG